MRSILPFAFLLFSLGSCAQYIKRSYAFSKPAVVGNAPSNEKQKIKEQYSYIAYMEAKENVSITMAWINRKSYDVQITPLAEKKAIPGKDLAGKEIMIRSSGNSPFIQLEFSLQEVQKKIPASYKNQEAGTILLEIRNKEKSSYYLIRKITPMASDLSIG